MTPKISVIVPVYKAETYLHRCVDSILAQIFRDFEVLLIDDGSPDRSGEICDQYAKSDSRIRVFHKKNGGVSSARNLGLDNAHGEWVMFIDADDWISKEAMKLSIDNSEQYDIIRFGYTSVLNKDCTQTKDSILQSADLETYLKLVAERKTTMSVWGAIFRRSLFTENNINFDISLRVGEDWLVLVNLIVKSKNVKILPLSLYFYNRYNEQGCINSFDFQKSKELITAFCKVCKLINESSYYKNISLSTTHIIILNEIFTTLFEKRTSVRTVKSYIRELEKTHRHPTVKEYISAQTSIKNKMYLFIFLHFTSIYYLMKNRQ